MYTYVGDNGALCGGHSYIESSSFQYISDNIGLVWWKVCL